MATRTYGRGRGRPQGSTQHSRMERLIARFEQFCVNLGNTPFKHAYTQVVNAKDLAGQMRSWWNQTGQHMTLQGARIGARIGARRSGARALRRATTVAGTASTGTTGATRRRTGTAG